MSEMLRLADELRAALDDPERWEWGACPWEHLGDAERDVRVLLDGIKRLRELRDRAPREPIGVDISDYSDVYCLGFLAGQTNALDAALSEEPQR